jgi:excisionase family DNA binding protein
MTIQSEVDYAQLGPNGSLVATPNQAMTFLGNGRATLYQLLNDGELESYTEGKGRRITWPSIHAYVKRRLAAGANISPNPNLVAAADAATRGRRAAARRGRAA